MGQFPILDAIRDWCLKNFLLKDDLKPAIPTKTSELINDSGYITDAGVTKVNGQTGDVNLTAENIGALPQEGNAVSATKLITARTIRTNLASASTASFNGTANIAPGVTGILPIANGGTGNSTGNVNTATKATQDGNGNVIADTYAKKSIYGDNVVSVGRKSNTNVGYCSAVLGGYGNTASEEYSAVLGGSYNEASGCCAAVLGGYYTTASNYSAVSIGKYNKAMTNGCTFTTQVGDVFVIGNGAGTSSKSNALRVTYKGEVYGTQAFKSSGADYAEHIKEWVDGNPENEDRVGYMVTIKNGLLHKANAGDYIAGITSGNPSVVGNADEDYYWRYERDEFNRIVMEDAPETVQRTDEEGNLMYDEETHEPIMIETGNIIPNARMKLADNYDPSLQENYIERKDRKEWDYVGMVGVIPVRDDGTCLPDHFCKCGQGGIATLAAEREFDTFYVIERISDNVVSVELR